MPSKSKNKSKMKNNQKKSTVSKKVQPVVEQAVQPGPVVDAPVVEEPVVEESVVAAAPVKQKGGAARKGKSKKQTKTPAKATETETEQVTEAFTETATATETTETRNTRSFKVLLPNSSEYVGRFTGLTPYQAANKALSKYYRETNKPRKQENKSTHEQINDQFRKKRLPACRRPRGPPYFTRTWYPTYSQEDIEMMLVVTAIMLECMTVRQQGHVRTA